MIVQLEYQIDPFILSRKVWQGLFFFLLDCVIWAFQSTACWGWTVWFCNNVGICNTGLLHNLSRAVLRLWNLSRVRLLFLAKTTGKPEIWSFVPCGMASFVHCNRWEPWPHDKTVHSLPCYGCYSLHRFLFSFVFPRSVLRFYLLGFLLRDAQDHFAVLFFLSFHSFSVVSLASGLDVLADPFHVYEITMLDALLLLHHFAIFHGSSFLFGCFRLVPSSHLQDSCSRCLDASAGLICHLESGCPVQRSRFCFYCFYWLCFYLACQKCQLPCNLCLLTCFGEFFLVLRCPYLCSVLDLFQYPLLASFAFFKSLLRRLVLRRWEGIVIITPLPLPPA